MSEFLPVRLSHFLRHCAVGAIVRGIEDPQYFLVIEDCSRWTDKNRQPAGRLIPYVDGVLSVLEIDKELREPPRAREIKKGVVDGACVPALRFPSWMRCPNCEMLFNKPWRKLDPNEKIPRCAECDKAPPLEHMRWVLVHEHGHLADIDWHFLTHRGQSSGGGEKCRADWSRPYLQIRHSSERSEFRLKCGRCGATASISEKEPIPFGNRPSQPWLSDRASQPENAPPGAILDVNDARIHSSIPESALVIPPESRICRGSVLDRLYSSSEWRDRIAAEPPGRIREVQLRKASRHFDCSVDELDAALCEIEKGYPLYGKSVTQGGLLESEYEVLSTEIPDNSEDEDLVTRHRTKAWKSLASTCDKHSSPSSVVRAVEQVVEVPRLKEIQVFRGFQRLGGEVVPPDITGEGSWLPALEFYGEGIFFTIDQQILRRWERQEAVQRRADRIRKRFGEANLEFHPEVRVSPRFLLLHTLSHLLIRQLETAAGYSAASIKERLYCAPDMAGVLLYVAVPDVAGSLGGLSELAEPRRFLRLFFDAFEHARWCSLDPVCSEHDGQGPGLLNRAACHGCALIPEPSCICANLLLDRCFIKGTGESTDNEGDRISPFLSFAQPTPEEAP